MLRQKGKPFGPFSQFRVDLVEMPEGLQAIGFDAGKSDAEGNAVAFLFVSHSDGGEALRLCRQQVESSPEWVEALKRAEDAYADDLLGIAGALMTPLDQR